MTVLPRGLRAWRLQRELSQKALAEKSGVSPTLIALIETGERQPSLVNALAITDALGIELEAVALVHADLDRFLAPPPPYQAPLPTRRWNYDEGPIRAAAAAAARRTGRSTLQSAGANS